MKKEDGGAAFPVDHYNVDSCGNERIQYQESGMSLRDYFAAKATQGIIENMGIMQTNTEFIATASYKIADAMIAERNK